MPIFRKALKGIIISTTIVLMIILICNIWVNYSTQQQIFDEAEKIPPRSVALVLGTIKKLTNGNTNRYFKYRVEAAAKLYHAGKVKHFIVSGDNHRKGYNEPEDMQISLIKLGVPKSAITLDYAGFRTLDSVLRTKKVFQQDKIIIISQKFHNTRALFIANQYDIDAIAFNAQGTKYRNRRNELREYLAKVKAVFDIYILKKQPKFLGEKINIKV